jgi:hypothetical protein
MPVRQRTAEPRECHDVTESRCGLQDLRVSAANYEPNSTGGRETIEPSANKMKVTAFDVDSLPVQKAVHRVDELDQPPSPIA